MKFENLACERIDDVLKVALNRPAKLNSLSTFVSQQISLWNKG